MAKLNQQCNKEKFCYPFFSFFIIVFLLPGYVFSSSNRMSPVVKTVKIVSPAVVNISSEYEVKQHVNPFSGFSTNPGLDNFFNDFFGYGYEQKYKRTNLGSGAIIDGNRGLILTNAHVITKAGKITVVLKDKRTFEAQIVGADADSDLAVLRIQSSKPLPSIIMGNSDDIMIGETVIAIGNPFGFSHTVTTGVVSAINRSIKSENKVFHDFIQTDASINPGNSGGPLINIDGELIGINTAIYGDAQGIGFAIPVNKAKRIITDLIKFGEVIQPWIGITVQKIDQEMAAYLQLPKPNALIVTDIETDSPADKSGIIPGDIILAIGNKEVASLDTYDTIINSYSSGSKIKLEVWRGAKTRHVTITATVFPREKATQLASQLMGITVTAIPKRSKHHRIYVSKGVMISNLKPNSDLARIGARPGDIIRQINEVTVNTMNDFEKAIVKYRKKNSVVILLQRGERGYYITVNL